MSAPRRPRSLGAALREVRAEVAPETPLARVQSVWTEALGARIAAEAEPVSERDGVVLVECRAATWAQELDLLQADLLARLNSHLGEDPITGLRFRAGGGA